MYNTKTIQVEENTITNDTERYEILLNGKTLHRYAIRNIDDKCNLITQKGNTYKTVTPYETKLSIHQILAIRDAYNEEEKEEEVKPAKKTSKATIKGKTTKKAEDKKDDKKKE